MGAGPREDKTLPCVLAAAPAAGSMLWLSLGCWQHPRATRPAAGCSAWRMEGTFGAEDPKPGGGWMWSWPRALLPFQFWPPALPAGTGCASKGGSGAGHSPPAGSRLPRAAGRAVRCLSDTHPDPCARSTEQRGTSPLRPPQRATLGPPAPTGWAPQPKLCPQPACSPSAAAEAAGRGSAEPAPARIVLNSSPMLARQLCQ